MLKDYTIIGTSHGLYDDLSKDMAVVWNISIRKAVAVVVPNDTKIYGSVVDIDGTSFDMTSEEFGEVYLPNTLAHSYEHEISKLRNSLVVLGNYMDAECFGLCIRTLKHYFCLINRILLFMTKVKLHCKAEQKAFKAYKLYAIQDDLQISR
ncbi:hypothetical protein L1987_65247 [Smallanthus sonchifolius]|uniref:Uncharacterized protein n=1 Tax=Smallanthus sonchifolius TaxID=185202 RepID=A0ACB9BTY1_9ASTR|nr:hypothetical protein L1987_65247 [Smallanthus sonchifolius]